MTIVVDASVVVAALLDGGPHGEACASTLASGALFAPLLLPFEVANVVRRTVARSAVDETAGALALADLERLAIDLVPFGAVAGRVWELRDNLTAYDAAYVAVAELLDAPLFTLDERLVRSTGPVCDIAVPSAN